MKELGIFNGNSEQKELGGIERERLRSSSYAHTESTFSLMDSILADNSPA